MSFPSPPNSSTHTLGPYNPHATIPFFFACLRCYRKIRDHHPTKPVTLVTSGSEVLANDAVALPKFRAAITAEIAAASITLKTGTRLDSLEELGKRPDPKGDERAIELHAFLIAIDNAIKKMRDAGKWKGGKVIAYSSDSLQDVRYLVNNATDIIPSATIYSAIDGERTDKDFINAPADGSIRILFACQRYREGSDVRGLDMTCALVGNTTAVYILLQICGRALRLDYDGKEGWCLIVRPSEQGVTEGDVLESIILDIIDFNGDSKKKREIKEIEPLIMTFLGEVSVSGSSLSVEETIKRVQAAYERRLYIRQRKASEGMTYKDLVTKVRSLQIKSRSEYSEKALLNELPENPSDIRGWISWYHMLRGHLDVKRMSLDDLQKLCKDNSIFTKDEYLLKTELPTWNELLDGYITDLPSPMPSYLESELFKSGRGGRR